jgi:hypothetical protein
MIGSRYFILYTWPRADLIYHPTVTHHLQLSLPESFTGFRTYPPPTAGTLTSYVHSPLPKPPPYTYHAAITTAHCIPTIPHPTPFNTSLLACLNLSQHHSIFSPIVMRPPGVPKTPHYIPRAINQCTPQKVTLAHQTSPPHNARRSLPILLLVDPAR